ncbi:T7SS effector LXG polymorphic toxin [Staphylococcus aureus]|nr:T7SS effector LXG polymorphic toxin [Staphylococcus aureus]
MGNKIKMSEVNNFNASLQKSLSSLSTNTKTLKNNINKLKDDSEFKGKTASNINSYNQSFHIETISRIEKIKEEIEKKIKDAIEDFQNSVDNDHNAILDEDAIEKYKGEVKKSIEQIESIKTRMNSTIGGVHDLTTAKTISGKDVKEKGETFNKQITDTLDNFNNFQSLHFLDDSELLSMITPVSTMASKVKNMPSNRSTISGNAGYIKSEYKLHSENNQFRELKKELEKYESAIYGGNKYRKTVKSMIEIKNALIVAYIAGDGNIFKGNELLAKNQLGKLGNKKLKLINATMQTNVENIEGKRLVKAAKFILDKNNKMKFSEKLKAGFKMTRNYSDTEFKQLEKVAGKYNGKSAMKRGAKAAWESMSQKQLREFLKNPKNLKNICLDEVKDFLGKNKLGKFLKSMRYAGKLLGPLGAVAAVANNVVNEKSGQKKIVGSIVDLGAIGGSTATGAAIGAAIGGPVGAVVGGIAGIVVGAASDFKLVGGKSLTDIAKDKLNNTVSSIRSNGFGKTLCNVF